MMKRTLLLAFAAGLLAGPAAAAYETGQFNDAGVNCSYGLTCTVSFVATTQGSPINVLALVRKAGDGSGLDLLVATDQLDAGSAVSIAIDGKPALSVPVEQMRFNERWIEYRLEGSPEPLKLLDVMRTAKTAEVSGVKDGKPTSASFSLDGLVAGLIFVDETQGRADTAEALQAFGEATHAPVKARDFASVAELPEGIRQRFTAPDGRCSFSDEGYLARQDAFEIEIPDGDGYSLVVLPCGESASYNHPYELFVGYRSSYEKLPIPTMMPKGPSTANSVDNFEWERADNRITGTFFGRALRDCGSRDTWQLSTGGAGPVLTLVEARFKECEGAAEGGQDEWPLIWPLGKN